MAFIRSKTVGGHKYYSLVENLREKGRVRQYVIANMYTCPTIEEAFQYWKKQLKKRSPFGSSFESGIASTYRTLSEVEILRAKRNMNALSEHRDPAIVAEEDRQRKARAKKRPQKRRVCSDIGTTFGARHRAAATLGLRPEHHSDPQAIKRGYRAMAKLHHPDVGGDPNKFREISEAYLTLWEPWMEGA